MRLAMIVLIFGTVANAFQNTSPCGGGPGNGIGSILERADLDSAEQHARTARDFESDQQWGAARREYEQVIQDAQSALRSNSTASEDPAIYFVLGLAEADAARMFLNTGLSQLFVSAYRQHLINADQFLHTANSLYKKCDVSSWHVSYALAMVHTLQGDLSGAQSDLQPLPALNPEFQPAAIALQQLNAVPQPLAQAAAALRANSTSLTDKQWKLIEDFGTLIALKLLPRQYQAAATITIAGFSLLRQWNKSSQQP
jgi:hypothetical protein